MNLENLTYFLTAARARSLTEAAGVLHISQQALSAQIAALEAEWGAVLLVRKVPLQLTHAGKLFYAYAEEVQNRTKSLRRAMEMVGEGLAGELIIGMAPTRGRVLLPDVVARFQKRYPGVSIHIQEETNAALLQKLREGHLDLIAASFPPAIKGLSIADFYTERIALVLPKAWAHSLFDEGNQALPTAIGQDALSRLWNCPFLMNSRDNIAGSMGRSLLARCGTSPHIAAESDNLETLMALAVRGCGAFFCPDNLARIMAGKASPLAILPIEGTEYPIRLGWRETDSDWHILRAFIKEALAVKGRGAEG